MSKRFVITGTDTGIGKTVFSAALTNALDGCYWKPIQSGIEDEMDSEAVRRLGSLSPDRILPEAWRFQTPVSPHLSAEIDGVAIDPDALVLPDSERPLVIEGAGGLLVPLTRQTTFIDVFARWRQPTILCARTGLGTINHTLLSIEAMSKRQVPIFGIVFIGDERSDTQRIISELSGVPILGRLPFLEMLTPGTLHSAFDDHFDISVFQEVAAA
ncbi:dethiobiotin synthase [Rhizobium sp. BK251]|uniref:dethiobiotin synthase n=1 Tax=Rhizobium sp. BK251 TaxID=2512125 RepID=UPI00104D477A|nr:dethiobiotin synthase [Rhizobium sp. BK251]TCL64136.1 dethiobiotin synthase [Rhizobium sp. BK251]